jgi:hypothetical protein
MGSTQHSAYRHEAGHTLIEIELREPRQLFHTLDPAPFRERDLDAQAESYLLAAAREIHPRKAAKLVIHLPESLLDSEDARSLAAAVRNYFDYRAADTLLQLRRLLFNGAVSLVIGVLFLLGCLSARRLVPGPADEELNLILGEGLLIIGWVALWRPLEIFLYDWWPLWQLRREQLRLAHLPVELRAGKAAKSS